MIQLQWLRGENNEWQMLLLMLSLNARQALASAFPAQVQVTSRDRGNCGSFGMAGGRVAQLLPEGRVLYGSRHTGNGIVLCRSCDPHQMRWVLQPNVCGGNDSDNLWQCHERMGKGIVAGLIFDQNIGRVSTKDAYSRTQHGT